MSDLAQQTPLGSTSIILASASPRRRALLEQAGLTFAVVPSRVDETRIMAGPPEQQVQRLAEAKAAEVAQRYRQSWIIAADTMVVLDHTVLGKPRTPDHARDMLKTLSGQTHRVLTGYCIACHQEAHSFSDTIETRVTFKELSRQEMNWYIATGEPLDKAGGYGIQGLGTFMINHVDGSYTNVVGLPVYEVIDYLFKAGALQWSPGKTKGAVG